MPIRKTGAVTGRVLGVEQPAAPEPEALQHEQEPEDTLVDRPLQGTRSVPDEDDD